MNEEVLWQFKVWLDTRMYTAAEIRRVEYGDMSGLTEYSRNRTWGILRVPPAYSSSFAPPAPVKPEWWVPTSRFLEEQ